MASDDFVSMHLNLPAHGTPEGDAYWKGVYAKAIIDPEAWKTTADSICEVLNILKPFLIEAWKSFYQESSESAAMRKSVLNTQPVILMLLAYALENLAKGLQIKRLAINPVTWDGKFPDLHKKHDIGHLVEAVCQPLALQEQQLLARLGPYARWAGRYPGPLNVMELQPKDKKFGNWTQTIGQQDLNIGLELIERLKKLYD
ncbi:hypothetical protein [Azonexus sp.]|uniref:hypothetical protein n=1 Tax=Azonexus sp. TaxID=1872668 RepID=UPI0035B31567